MGSFDARCFLTGLSIQAGDTVYALFCRRAPSYRGLGSTVLSEHGFTSHITWEPLTLPIKCTYDDYGGIQSLSSAVYAPVPKDPKLEELMNSLDLSAEDFRALFFRGASAGGLDAEEYCTVLLSDAYERIPHTAHRLHRFSTVFPVILEELGYSPVPINPPRSLNLPGREKVLLEGAAIPDAQLTVNGLRGTLDLEGTVLKHDFSYYLVRHWRWLLEYFGAANLQYAVNYNNVFDAFGHFMGAQNSQALSYFDSISDQLEEYNRFNLFCEELGLILHPTAYIGQGVDNSDSVAEYAEFLRSEALRAQA